MGASLAQEAVPTVSERDVKAERVGDGFRVSLTMRTPAPAEVTWTVLTDFDHMAGFIPNLKSSQIVERRSASVMQVRQTGVARYGVLSTAFESVREIRLFPTREIRAEGVGGNITSMRSTMRLESSASGTVLHYEAEGSPGFWFPPVIGPALLRHETAEQFTAMLKEISRRAGAEGKPG